MEIKGKLQIILPLVEGQGKNGVWRKQEFVIETLDNYPKKVVIHVWGEKVDDFKKYKIGDVIICSLEISSREFNGKWYTDVRAWKIVAGDNVGAQNNDNVPFAENELGVTSNSSVAPDNNWEGDLPF